MAVERNPFEGSKQAVELDELEEKVEAVTAPDGIEIEIEGEEEIEVIPMESEHYANLVSECDEEKLKEIASEVIEGFNTDKDSREEWEETFERGFDLLGLKLQETNEPFEGACTAVHPLLIESAVKFQSKASQELFPSGGPVKAQILGKVTPERELQAQRVKQFMNYQLTDQMPEYFDEFERMLFHLPLVGSAFKKIYYDMSLERPVSEFIPVDQFYVSYYATDLRRADRYTHLIYRSPNDMRRDIASGMYADVDLPKASTPNQTTMGSKIDEIMGFTQVDSTDPQYTLLEQHCYLNLDDNEDAVALPYVVTVEQESRQVLCIRRNYDENDPKFQKKLHFTHYKYVPGFGFYGLGLIHFLGNLTMTATTAMRSLVDAGQFANLPGGFKARGVRMVGDNAPVAPGEFKEVEATGIDLSKAIIPLPYKEPSQTLMAMLNFVVGAGQKFADSTEQVIAESTNYGPVGTTMALLEASSRFFTAIHKRLHKSQRDEFQLLAQINYDFLPENYPYEVIGGDQSVMKMDFDGRIDVAPVSDPNIPSSAHRAALSQMALSLAQQTPPGMFNMRALYHEVLSASNFPNLEQVLPPEPQPEPRDPMGDILAISQSLPIKAFPGQNHQAHITFKTAFLQDPLLGKNPLMKMGVPILEANIREHILLQYQEQLGGIVQESGVANDPQTMEMVMAQAAEQIAQANANQAAAMSPEQQMLMNEQQRIELDEQKANVEAVKDVSELAIRNREVDLKEDELAVKAMTEAGKLALKDKEGAAKSMELAARIALDAEKMDSGIDERQANKAIDTFLKVTEMENKDATKKRKE